MPTASQVRITAEILWGSITFSITTVRFGCRRLSTPVSFALRSGVINWLVLFVPSGNIKQKQLFLQPNVFRDVAQPGSALRSGRRGRWFESSHPDRTCTRWHRVIFLYQISLQRPATLRCWRWSFFPRLPPNCGAMHYRHLTTK
jgi:hypothetical protein